MKNLEKRVIIFISLLLSATVNAKFSLKNLLKSMQTDQGKLRKEIKVTPAQDLQPLLGDLRRLRGELDEAIGEIQFQAALPGQKGEKGIKQIYFLNQPMAINLDDPEALTTFSFSELIAEAEEQQRPFILAVTEDKNGEIHFFDAYFLLDALGRNQAKPFVNVLQKKVFLNDTTRFDTTATNPMNRQPIETIGFYSVPETRRNFVRLGVVKKGQLFPAKVVQALKDHIDKVE